MTIKRKILTITILPSALIAGLVLALLLSYSTVYETMRKDRMGEKIQQGVFQLNILTSNYIMYPSERPKQQWVLQHKSIQHLINTISFQNDEEKRLLSNIRDKHREINADFQELTAIYESPESVQDKQQSTISYEERLKGQLLIHTDAMVSDTVRLSDLNYASLLKHLRKTSLIVISSFIAVMIIMLIISYIVGRSIFRPIMKLHEATGIIAGGGLDHRINITSSDELGQLSKAFNDMSGNLHHSLADLTDEITERKTAEEKLDRYSKELDSIYNSITDFLTVIDRDFKILRVNRAIEQVWGNDLIGKVCYEAYQGRDTICPDCPTAIAIETKESAFSIQDPPVEGVPSVEIFAFPILNKSGEVIAVVEHGKDITTRLKTEKALKKSEEKYRRLFTTVSTSWAYHKIVTDEEGNPVDYIFLEVNSAFENMTGLQNESIVGKPVTEVLPGIENDPADWINKYGSVALTGNEMKFENYSEALHKWFLVSATCPEKGYFITVFEDITERKQAEEHVKAALKEKEVLLQEIHHRVKNNMTVITSLLKLQSRHAKGLQNKGIFNDSINRIQSMAMIHEKLYKSEDLSHIDFAPYLREMIVSMFKSYGPAVESIQLEMDMENMSLDLDTAIPCGLIVNELMSNALKHAFPGNNSGTITISLHMIDKNIEILVADTGIGISQELELETIDSLGLNLVNTLARQLKGTVSIGNNNGTEVRVTFRRAEE